MDPNADMDAEETREVTGVLKASADELLAKHPPMTCPICQPVEPGQKPPILRPRLGGNRERLGQSDGPMDTAIYECNACGLKRSVPLKLKDSR